MIYSNVYMPLGSQPDLHCLSCARTMNTTRILVPASAYGAYHALGLSTRFH
jgi:hypothetical protein